MEKKLTPKEMEEIENAFKKLVDDLGPNDSYKEALIEILLETIYEETISILGKERQD